MESDLRQLIISKCRAKGISVEHLAHVSDCSVTELKGYEQGLFILSVAKLKTLVQTLSITNEELISALGDELAKRFIDPQGD